MFRAHHVQPAASLIKLLIVVSAYQSMRRKGRTLDSLIAVQQEDLVASSDSLEHVKAGEKLPLRNLV